MSPVNIVPLYTKNSRFMGEKVCMKVYDQEVKCSSGWKEST